MSIEIRATRRPGYFLWQFFLPLGLIVAASWLVFWIHDFSDQLATTFTLMLTVVAFNFYTATLLPRLPYNTFIETVIISGYVCIFLTIVAILLAHVIGLKWSDTAAKRVLASCRTLFPLGYAASIVLIITAFFGR